MIGGKDGNNQIVAPGIAPRAFETIYELVDANKYVGTHTHNVMHTYNIYAHACVYVYEHT
jgi:cyclophilin family peptidyl-prolyl cis-trans isomerase